MGRISYPETSVNYPSILRNIPERADHIYVAEGAWEHAGSQYLRLLKDDPLPANSNTRTTDQKAVF